MPRPTRSRPAAQASNNTASDTHEEEQETRGRSRTTRSSGLRLSISERKALDIANESRDAALDRLANEDMTTTGDNTQDSLEFGRRDDTATTPALRRDITGLDLDSVVLDLDESFEDGDIPFGGRSADNSSYHISRIKPRSRSRQSSIIGRNDAPIRPSSRSGMTPLVSSSFNIGAFRRRAREPSILGTGRKTQPDVTTTTTNDQGSEDESEEDFAPEAESTPVNNRRRTRQSLRQDETNEMSPAIQEPPSSRKRKSNVDPADDDARPSKVSRPQESLSGQESDSDSALSSLPSPQVMALAIERPVTPTNLYNEEDAASPVSSVVEGGDAWPDIRNLAKRRRRPSVADPTQLETLSNVSSPPSLTHSPNYHEAKISRRGRSRTQRQLSPTTADLANLLPKRRNQRMRSPADGESDGELDADGLGRDDDELSYLDASGRRGQKSRSISRAATTRSARRAQSALGEKDTPATNTRRSSRHGATYSRRASNKENQDAAEDEEGAENEASRFEPLAEDSFTGETGDASYLSTSNELNQAKAKFQEVDRWELEYEEASEPPSPVGAR